MPIIDFTEISEGNKGGDNQDAFEMFSRDFFEILGYKNIEGPDRGPDGGRDLILLEIRKGIGGESHIKWLVSCKHHAHSGKAVSVNDELNILERVEQNSCNGFIGFYSTIPSSALITRLESLKNKIEYQTFDKEQIESHLLSSSAGHNLSMRYFPISFENWQIENPKPAKIFSDQNTLYCEHCGKDLLDPISGIIVTWKSITNTDIYTTRYIDFYWCCKGECDTILKSRHNWVLNNDSWEDITDISIPLIYIKNVMIILNEFHRGNLYSQMAFDKMKTFLLILFQYVSREITKSENDRIESLLALPPWMGGLSDVD